jgi:propanediol dehydratase small subunit
MKRLGLSLLLAGLLAGEVAAQDVNVAQSTVTQYVDVDRNDAWVNINKAFLFTPKNADQSQCLYLHNQNTTSSHTITLGVFQTGDSQITTFTGQTDHYIQIALTGSTLAQNVSVTVGPLATKAVFFRSVAAARVAMNFSGSTTQAGSPDNVDLFIVQTTQPNCGVSAPTPSALGLPTQSQIPLNSFGTSGVNIAQTVTLAGIAGQQVRLSAIDAFCSAGTAQIIVQDNGVTIWQSPATEVGITRDRIAWSPPLTASVGNPMSVQVTACGAGNTSSLALEMDRYPLAP